MTNESLNELFYDNPCPMWVFDAETHFFLEVNEAACKKYGYTREEFMQLTTLDIRPKSEHLKYHHAMKYAFGMKSTGKTFVHIDKAGKEFMVKPLSFEMVYNGRKALAIQIIDIEDYNTERLRNKILAAKLQKELELLTSVSQTQSHDLRSRIANLKAIVLLLKEKLVSAQEISDVVNMMDDELNKADDVIKDMIKQIGVSLNTKDIAH